MSVSCTAHAEARRRADGSCLECMSEYNRKYYAKRKGELKRRATERNRRLGARGRFYGMTDEDFANALAAQGDACAICGTTEPGGTGWAVDHDHDCCSNPNRKTCGNCIRGILCPKCNLGLGHFNDDPERLLSAIEYLARWTGLNQAKENSDGK